MPNKEVMDCDVYGQLWQHTNYKGLINRSPSSLLRVALPGVLLAVVVLLPFLGKAHTVDDVTFLLMSEHVLKDPLHPTGFDIVEGGRRFRLSSELVSGPVMAYLLIPSILLDGSEWAAHLIQIALMVAAILATVRLGLYLGLGFSEARLAGLLLAATPAVIVMGTTSMPDVPAMAFGVLGMERLVKWKDRRKIHQCATAGLFFALAVLSRPHLFVLLAIALLMLFGGPERLGTRGSRQLNWERCVRCCPIILAILIVFAIAHITADPIHVNNNFVNASISRFHLDFFRENFIAYAIHWVLVLPMGIPWLWMRVRWLRIFSSPFLWLAVTIFFVALLMGKSGLSGLYAFPIAVIGLAVILDVLIEAVRRHDHVQLTLGGWLLLAIPTAAYMQLPCKYLVPSAPAVALLVARLWGSSSPLLRRTVGLVTISAGVLIGVLVASADAQFAAVGKRAAHELIAPRVRSGQRVWVDCELGFKWYAIKAGAIPLSDQYPQPSYGDFIVSSLATSFSRIMDRFPNRALVVSLVENSRFGRIWSTQDGAGFYSTHWGFFPWTWRNGEIEKVTVWRVLESP